MKMMKSLLQSGLKKARQGAVYIPLVLLMGCASWCVGILIEDSKKMRLEDETNVVEQTEIEPHRFLVGFKKPMKIISRETEERWLHQHIQKMLGKQKWTMTHSKEDPHHKTDTKKGLHVIVTIRDAASTHETTVAHH